MTQPEDLFSAHGVLSVNLSYETEVDANGNRLYCFVTDTGAESPTLHVHPGDRLQIRLKNNLPADLSSGAMAAMPGMSMSMGHGGACGASTMTAASVNIHYHGTNTPPTCHQDEVIRTLVNAGDTFQYDVQFPADEPPGLYWYHPHVHGISEAAVQGGASGAIIVEGIQNINPETAGLPQQTLILRDNLLPGNPDPADGVPAWDISLNYVPVAWPQYMPAVIAMKPGERQLWRVLNASADTIIDLQLVYDGAPQPLEVIALDGVPTGSQDGMARGRRVWNSDVLLGPGARAEFIVNGPPDSVKSATLLTLNVDTGPAGDNDPMRPIANVRVSDQAPEPPLTVPAAMDRPSRQRFERLDFEKPSARRTIYFSENSEGSAFFITVDGQTPAAFSPDNPPAIVTTQGSVEDWVIENRTQENHEFHIHQIHFLELEENGIPVNNPQYLDTINVPYWTGSGPYPSVKLRMDFRGPAVGDFVYHCHILEHEDGGMMAIIRVKPRVRGRR